MPFPEIEIEPLVAIIVYDITGTKIFLLEQPNSEFEKEEISKYFIQPVEFYQWVRRYNEITIFRGRFRATYITFVGVTLLFVSRVENIGAEIRPKILNYINKLGIRILNGLTYDTSKDLIKTIISDIETVSEENLEGEINKIFNRLGIEKPEKVIVPIDQKTRQDAIEKRIQTFESIKPFESVPQISASDMTQEIVDEANKRAITSLLFSSIRSCDSPAAAAYIYPKNGGAMGELYAGNLEEKKIIYVLETLTKFPRVIHEMVNSAENIKFLNAEIIQIIVEDCGEGKLLLGMTTNVNDVINVAYKFKIVKHILSTMGF